MADTSVAVTQGAGTAIDTRTEATNGNHRQVVVLGDPSLNAGVAPVDATNGLSVAVTTSVLPTSAATSAKQDTGNTSVASIDTKTPSLGQAAKASSRPVTLPTDPDSRPSSGTITTADAASSTASGFNSVSIITGSATANSTQSVAINGQSSYRSQVTGTWVGTLQHELSVDGGTTWVSTGPIGSGTVFRVGPFTANGTFFGGCAGATHVRVRATAFSSGTATVQFTFTAVSGLIKVDSPTSLADNSTGAQNAIQLGSTGAPASSLTAMVVNLREGIPAGTNSIGAVSPAASAANGWTTHTKVSAATTNATSVKGSAGTLHSFQVFNQNASVRYLKFADKASAMTPGSDASVLIVAVPPGSGVCSGPIDALFASGITYCTVTGATEADTTAVAVNEMHINVEYK